MALICRDHLVIFNWLRRQIEYFRGNRPSITKTDQVQFIKGVMISFEFQSGFSVRPVQRAFSNRHISRNIKPNPKISILEFQSQSFPFTGFAKEKGKQPLVPFYALLIKIKKQ